MRIPVLKFEVQETRTWTERLPLLAYIRRQILGPEIQVHYHFNIHMKVDRLYLEHARELQKNDTVSLPNGVQLRVWSVDRFGVVKAKTFKPVLDDLRGYRPMEMYLVYPRVHGHLSDKPV